MDEISSVYLISALAFVAIIALIEGGYLLWRSLNIPAALRVSRRLHQLSAAGTSARDTLSILRGDNLSDIPIVSRILAHIPRVRRIDSLLEQSGSTMTVARFLLIQLMLSLALVLLLLLMSTPLWIGLVVGVVIGTTLPAMWFNRRRDKRRALFTAQLPDTLDFLSRSLRAGNPLVASFKSVAENMPEPSASEFALTFNELNFGIDLHDAMDHLARRTGSEEMHYFVTAVLIQRSTGGNLAEILSSLAAVMRSRTSTYREIRILAAEMRFSANVLVALPFIVAAAVSLISPGYLSVLFTTDLGMMVIGAQLFLMGVGYWIVHRMINFRV
jgi:tight adherence protein B